MQSKRDLEKKMKEGADKDVQRMYAKNYITASNLKEKDIQGSCSGYRDKEQNDHEV